MTDDKNHLDTIGAYDKAKQEELEIERHLQELKRQREGKEVARQIADYLNGHNAKEVVLGMAQEHRTLQQAFTGLCVQWLEHCAALRDGQFDGRNQASVELARKLAQTEVWQEAKYLPYI